MAKKKGPKAGRAKLKQKSQRPAQSSWSSPGQNRGYAVDSDDDDDLGKSHTMFRGFDGSTTRHFSSTRPAVKLRHRSVAFVSAGTNTPMETDISIETEQREISIENDGSLKEELAMTGLIADTASPEVNIVAESLTMHCQISGLDGTSDDRPMPDDNDVSWVVDTDGDPALAQSAANLYQPNKVQQPSPVDHSSSDDEIVFRGRNKPTVIDDPLPAAKHVVLPPHLRSKAVVSSTEHGQSSASGTTDNTWRSKPKSIVEADTGFTPAPSGRWWRQTTEEPVAPVAPSAEQEQAAREGAETTVALLQAAYHRAKQAEQDKRNIVSPERVPHKLSKREKRLRRRDELRQQAQDSDPEVAAYADYMENIRMQEEDNQIQAEETGVVDLDASEWEDTGISDTVSVIIGQVIGEVEDESESGSDVASSELEEELEMAEKEFHLAQDRLHHNRIHTMSDAHLAHLFAKQQAMGIDGDELVIDDGDYTYMLDDQQYGDLDAARSGMADYLAFPSRKKKGKQRQHDVHFPDASAMADAIDQYGNDGFDIMDYERPSLRATRKGRKGAMPYELQTISDDELRENMLAAWDNDRAKKRTKKAEREELRMQGLLGPKHGKADLSQKYQQGMTLENIHVELHAFIQDDGKTSRSFPPMDKVDRKRLHEIASKLNLKSKSVGTGENRAPVLYKTKSTPKYDEATVERAVRSMSGRFLRNQSFKGQVAKKGAASVKRVGGGAFTGLRHGELVGAGAKEIGKENFGSKLMEKMGWTRGTALGKDGEGVLHPVEQVMRIGKAGLG